MDQELATRDGTNMEQKKVTPKEFFGVRKGEKEGHYFFL